MNKSESALKHIKKLIYNHMEFVYNVLAVYGPILLEGIENDAGI